MNTSKTSQRRRGKLRQAPVRVSIDAHGGASWSMTNRTIESSIRFQKIINRSLHAIDSGTEPQGTLDTGWFAARLVCLDAVRPDQLDEIDAAGRLVYRIGSDVAIEWKSTDGRQERRFLSPATCAAWNKLVNSCNDRLQDPSESIDQHASLAFALSEWIVSLGLYPGSKDMLGDLADDQLAWLVERLPGPLFGHCSGALCLTALPRSAWARRVAADHAAQNSESITSALMESPTPPTATERCLDIVDNIGGLRVDTNLLQTALDVLKLTKGDSKVDGHVKRAWVTRLSRLPLRESDVSKLTVIMVGWIVHLCESGTTKTPDLAASTIGIYARKALIPLASAITAQGAFLSTSMDWDRQSLSIAYETVLGTGPNVDPIVSAAIFSFQEYLSEYFDVEFVGVNTKGLKSIPAVAAAVLWPRDVRWVLDQLSNALPERWAQIARIQLLIASATPLRHQDLGRMLMRNFAFSQNVFGDYVEIEIARDASRGRLKTETSQRRVVVSDDKAVREIRTFIEQRSSEGCRAHGLIFAAAGRDDQLQQPNRIRSTLNRLIKLATGSPDSRFYDLRHTVVSHQVEEVLSSCSSVDVNRLDVIAATAGHGSPLTTLRSYSHLYEPPLRMWLDHEILESVDINAEQMTSLIQEFPARRRIATGNALVQSARRNNQPISTTWWNFLKFEAMSLQFEAVSQPFNMVAPKAPEDLTTTTHEAPNLVLATDVVYRLAIGEPIHSVARSLEIDLVVLQTMVDELSLWLHRLYVAHFPRLAKREVNLPATPEARLKTLLSLLDVDMRGTKLPMWGEVPTALDTEPASEASDAILPYWMDGGHGGYLSLVNPESVRLLLVRLHTAKLQPGHLRVIAADGFDVQPAIDVVTQELRAAPMVEKRKARRDRPGAYLVFSSAPNSAVTSSRSDRTGAFKGWLVGLRALQILQSLSQDPHAKAPKN